MDVQISSSTPHHLLMAHSVDTTPTQKPGSTASRTMCRTKRVHCWNHFRWLSLALSVLAFVSVIRS